jgi:lysyl-tRNA synthetase class 2
VLRVTQFGSAVLPASKLGDLNTAAGAVKHHGQEVLNFEQGLKSSLARQEPAEQLVTFYEKLIEPTLIDPTFVTQVPSVIVPLARKNPADPFFCDVYELAINGQEISPGYTELNDPDVQREKLLDQVGDKAERQEVDEDFLNALKYGMPPAGGLGLGIDRLVMMLTGAESIRDVILFPLMRPQT